MADPQGDHITGSEVADVGAGRQTVLSAAWGERCAPRGPAPAWDIGAQADLAL